MKSYYTAVGVIFGIDGIIDFDNSPDILKTKIQNNCTKNNQKSIYYIDEYTSLAFENTEGPKVSAREQWNLLIKHQ